MIDPETLRRVVDMICPTAAIVRTLPNLMPRLPPLDPAVLRAIEFGRRETEMSRVVTSLQAVMREGRAK